MINKIISYILSFNVPKKIIRKRIVKYWDNKIEPHNSNNLRLFWGPNPIKNNVYFSKALQQRGYESKTVMKTFFGAINNREDFDLYFDEIFSLTDLSKFRKLIFKDYIIFDFLLKNFDIFHIPFTQLTPLGYEFESSMLKRFGKKTILLGYGSDYYQYSKVENVSIQHALQKSYPEYAKQEHLIHRKMNFWFENADFIVGGVHVVDGFSRWDCLPFNYLCIDTEDWRVQQKYSEANGENGEVRILHTPNHRGFKGTEFIIRAVEELKKEGYKVKLTLLEGVQNDEVKRILNEETDILVEQLVFVGYALSAIEAMSSGVCVVGNLEDKRYTELFRNYSYLNECPILSSSIKTIKDHLKVLVTNPKLRKELGQSGRKYVQKYHSLENASTLFDKIYNKLYDKTEINMMDYYHPLSLDSYNNQSLKIEHPLIENKLPASYKYESK